MLHQPLISAQELKQFFVKKTEKILLIDARYDLSNPCSGFNLYQQGHIPNAHYLDLDKALCGEKTGRNGRHPLPTQASFIQHLRHLGINRDTHIIVYDQQDSMFAAHLWWMFLWVGHSKVQVLNGGLNAWTRDGGTLCSEPPPLQQQGNIEVQPSLTPTVDASYILKHLHSPEMLIIDARAPERYRGDIEPLDPVAGHIPGAINRPFSLNATENGLYKPKEALKQEWSECITDTPTKAIVQQCGSGVSACHNILAMVYAGLGMTTLYPGSWSEWCANTTNPTTKE